jgi:hypothetical protein
MMLKMMEDKENRSTTWRNEAIILASFSLSISHCGGVFLSNLYLPNHTRKSTKTESEVGTGVEWMGYLIKFDMHCVGGKSLSLYIPLRCDQTCFE